MRAKDTINQLKEEISNLSKLVEKGAGLSVGQENMVKELIRVRDELTLKTGEQDQTIRVRRLTSHIPMASRFERRAAQIMNAGDHQRNEQPMALLNLTRVVHGLLPSICTKHISYVEHFL